ncbi:MAG: hypothetical protein ABIM99_03335 [Candidatus Dojkabacteria bacterium]
MRISKRSVFLNTIILIVLMLSGLSYAPKDIPALSPQEVCAETVNATDTGLSCIRKFGDCPTGFKTLIEELQSDSFILTGNNLSSSSFQGSLAQAYGTNGLYNTCVSTQYNKVITIFTSNEATQAGASRNDDIPKIADRDVPRLCEPNTFPSSADDMVGPGIPAPGWGCCPSNYNYVSQKGLSEINLSQGSSSALRPDQRMSGCCPKVDGIEAHEWLPDGLNGSHCMIAIDRNDIQKSQPLQPNGATIPEFPNNTGEFSIYGKPLGKNQVNDSGPVLRNATQDPNLYICPEGSACVADPSADFYGTSTDSSGSQKGLASCSATPIGGDNSSPTSKVKCYAEGEFIGTIDQGGVKLVRKCSASSAKFYVDVKACNNSLSDELACRGVGKVSETNYKLCCNCREAGGVWTGIGCTDTSPLGIITGIIRIVFGVVGGIALLQIIIAGIMYQTGDEARIKAARESIIKTLTGLAVLVFSILILRIIGINILDVLPVGSV